ncbi:MAG: VWA domain-containing protein [Desulfobacteraceae bacterium]|nr:MAG: VWA domain-containing protein [Desulfobacteraceae bacterium]
MFRKKCGIAAVLIAISIFLSVVIGKECWSKEYSPNVHWIFCIDTSGSMKAKGHRDLLKLITQKITNEFTDIKRNIIKVGDRITVFSFDSDVRLEMTALYQTENDILPIRDKLNQMNKRSGKLTFISEAIVQAVDFTRKYKKFFHTNALYVFTDGKSEPYSKKWPKAKIEARRAKDKENFKKISLSGKDQGLNVWLGVLKWEAFNDAKSLVKKMGKGGHLVDLTDFNRLSLEKALNDFAQTVRSKVRLAGVKGVDLGTIPYDSARPYQKNITWNIETDKANEVPSIMGRINFDPDNPSEMPQGYPLDIKTTADKMVLNFRLARSEKLRPGIYKGKLELLPSQASFGALEIEPSQFSIEFKKAGFVSFYFWRVLMLSLVCILILFFLVSKIKRKMPIRV